MFSIPSTYAQFVIDELLKIKEDDMDKAIELKDLKLGDTAVGTPHFCKLGAGCLSWFFELRLQRKWAGFSNLYEIKRELDNTAFMKFYLRGYSDISQEYADQLKKNFFIAVINQILVLTRVTNAYA